MTQPFYADRKLSPYAEDVVAELAVLRALEAAGKRARLSRSVMAEARTYPSHTVHERFLLARTRRECDRLLRGVWDHLQLVLPEHAEQIARACDGYVRDLIVRQAPHDRDALVAYLHARIAG